MASSTKVRGVRDEVYWFRYPTPRFPSALNLQAPYTEEEMARFRGSCAPSNDPVLQYPKGTELEVQGTPKIYAPIWNYGKRAFILSRKENAPGVPVDEASEQFRSAAEKGAPVLAKGVIDEHGYLSVLDIKPAVDLKEPAAR